MILIVISYSYVSLSCVFPAFAPLLVCMSVNNNTVFSRIEAGVSISFVVFMTRPLFGGDF